MDNYQAKTQSSRTTQKQAVQAQIAYIERQTQQVWQQVAIAEQLQMPSTVVELLDSFSDSYNNIGRFVFDFEDVKREFKNDFDELDDIAKKLKKAKDSRSGGGGGGNPEPWCRKFCQNVGDFVEQSADLIGKIADKLIVELGSKVLGNIASGIARLFGADPDEVAFDVVEKYRDACGHMARAYEQYYRRLRNWVQNNCLKICSAIKDMFS